MKKIIRIFTFALLIGFVLTACTGKKDGEAGGALGGDNGGERKIAGATLLYKYGTWVKDNDSATSFSFEQISGQRLATFKLNGEDIVFQTYRASNDDVEIHVGPSFDDKIMMKAEFSSDDTKMYVSQIAFEGIHAGSMDLSAAIGTYTLQE